ASSSRAAARSSSGTFAEEWRTTPAKFRLVIETDYLVIGSGLAGLYFALRAAEHGRVVVAPKRAPADANTAYAQGGVAGALDPEDTVATHVEDTLRVGDGLCHRDIVELCARGARAHPLVRRRARRAVRPRRRRPPGAR